MVLHSTRAITSDAGALLLRHTDKAIGLFDRVAACFSDQRNPGLVVHSLQTMVSQRITAIALGYEDIDDHDTLRHDRLLGLLGDGLAPKRRDCAALAGKSTLNRLEHAPVGAATRYHRIGHDTAAIEGLFVDLFIEAHKTPPREIVLDLDATDDPVHGHQEGRFFHGYGACPRAGEAGPGGLLVLLAALRLLRPASAGGPAQARQYRRQRRISGGGGAHRGPDTATLAAREDRAARQFGLCP